MYSGKRTSLTQNLKRCPDTSMSSSKKLSGRRYLRTTYLGRPDTFVVCECEWNVTSQEDSYIERYDACQVFLIIS